MRHPDLLVAEDLLAKTRQILHLASTVPVDLSLSLLTDAFHHLEATIDTLRQARNSTAERFVGIDYAAPSREITATAVIERQRLAELIAQTKAA